MTERIIAIAVATVIIAFIVWGYYSEQAKYNYQINCLKVGWTVKQDKYEVFCDKK